MPVQVRGFAVRVSGFGLRGFSFVDLVVRGFRFGVCSFWVSRSEVSGSRFGVSPSGLRVRGIRGSRFRVRGFQVRRFKVQGFAYGVMGSEFQGLEF